MYVHSNIKYFNTCYLPLLLLLLLLLLPLMLRQLQLLQSLYINLPSLFLLLLQLSLLPPILALRRHEIPAFTIMTHTM